PHDHNNVSHLERYHDRDWALSPEMIGMAGERLARVAPGLPRVLGGISPIDPLFIGNLFRRGIGDAIDVVAVHGFPLDWNRWHLSEWPKRIELIREHSRGRAVWAPEVGESSIVSPTLQAWAVDATLEQLSRCAEQVFWYALMDLPERWEAVTRHRHSAAR